jgi:WD40 repeat protein
MKIPITLVTVLGVMLMAIIPLKASLAQDSILQNQNSILDVEFSPDGHLLAEIDSQGRLQIQSVTSQTIVLKYEPEIRFPLISARIAWSNTGSYFAAGIAGQIYIWTVNAQDFEMQNAYGAGGSDDPFYFVTGEMLPEGIVSLQWDSTDTLLLAKSLSSRLTVWSNEEQSLIADQTYGNNPIPVVWLADNRTIWGGPGTSFFDLQTQIFTLQSPQNVSILSNNCTLPTSIEVSADHNLMVLGTGNGCILIVNTSSEYVVGGYKITNAVIVDLDVSPDGTQIAAADANGNLRIVDVMTGDSTVVAQNDAALYAVDWSPTNSFIAYAGVNSADAAVMQTLSVQAVEQMIDSRPAEPAPLAITPPPSAS